MTLRSEIYEYRDRILAWDRKINNIEKEARYRYRDIGLPVTPEKIDRLRREFEEARQNIFIIIKPFLTRDETGKWIENEASFERAPN